MKNTIKNIADHEPQPIKKYFLCYAQKPFDSFSWFYEHSYVSFITSLQVSFVSLAKKLSTLVMSP